MENTDKDVAINGSREVTTGACKEPLDAQAKRYECNGIEHWHLVMVELYEVQLLFVKVIFVTQFILAFSVAENNRCFSVGTTFVVRRESVIIIIIIMKIKSKMLPQSPAGGLQH